MLVIILKLKCGFNFEFWNFRTELFADFILNDACVGILRILDDISNLGIWKSNGADGVARQERAGALEPEITLEFLATHEVFPSIVRLLDGIDSIDGAGWRLWGEDVLSLAVSRLVIDQPIDNTGKKLGADALQVLQSLHLVGELRILVDGQDLVINLNIPTKIKNEMMKNEFESNVKRHDVCKIKNTEMTLQ